MQTQNASRIEGVGFANREAEDSLSSAGALNLLNRCVEEGDQLGAQSTRLYLEGRLEAQRQQ